MAVSPPPPPPMLGPPPPAPAQLAPSAASSAKPSAEERLKRLDDLKQKGLLTEQEYKQKRAEILKDL